MRGIDSKSYLPHLNKLENQYNNTYHHSINKKPINIDYSALTEKTETNHKAHKFKVNDRVRITKYENIFSKSDTENWSREIFIIDFVFKTNPSIYKIKDLNGEEIIESFYEKYLLRIKLKMSCFPEPDNKLTSDNKQIISIKTKHLKV